MRARKLLFTVSVSVALFGAALGCSGSDGPKMARVSGIVTHDDKPVEGAIVIFNSPLAPRNAAGTTDAAGKFQLQTIEKLDGAVLGDHTVSIVKPDPSLTAKSDVKTVEVTGASSGTGGDVPSGANAFKAKTALPSSTSPGGMMAAPKKPSVNTLLPVKYADAKTSGLTAKVVEGKENTFEFKLTGK